ncbi:hypothetical protein IRJ41_001735 [Triplophysa rosa]|uniref:Secreted protein n=1 Tax=Triplophysa rosa TaxID=992332 RepID=A0A9W7TD72_TRIRA|nr:hypothetical protein IRJ41_001735 [Triplophysa rosa]
MRFGLCATYVTRPFLSIVVLTALFSSRQRNRFETTNNACGLTRSLCSVQEQDNIEARGTSVCMAALCPRVWINSQSMMVTYDTPR